jgi:hypothetical protein
LKSIGRPAVEVEEVNDTAAIKIPVVPSQVALKAMTRPAVEVEKVHNSIQVGIAVEIGTRKAIVRGR